MDAAQFCEGLGTESWVENGEQRQCIKPWFCKSISLVAFNKGKKREGRSSPWDLEASAFQIVAMLRAGQGSCWCHSGTHGALGPNAGLRVMRCCSVVAAC